MAKRLVWAPSSLDSIDKTADYIAMDSVFYAKTFVKKVFAFGEQIALFPESGRVVPEYNNELVREIIWGNYRIVYRIDDDIVNVLTVSNSAQMLVIPELR